MGKWLDFVKKKIKNGKEVSHENVTCKNCGTHFSGNYCPECGQSVQDYDKPFSFIFYNFLGDFFAFDTRFFRTFGLLLIKPGFLTVEYFKGRRVRYAPPFRIFIFVSFIFFLLLQNFTNLGLTAVLDANFSDNEFIDLDSASMELADSILNEVIVEVDSVHAEDLNSDSFQDTRDIRNGLNKFGLSLEKKLEKEEDPKERAKLKEYIRLSRSPEQAMAKVLQYLSWAFFLLLPIFALILKLAYIRRKQNYIRHLVFSIHSHSYIFIILTLLLGIYLVANVNIGGVIAILIISIPVYLILALKKFYGQSFGKVFLKFVVISFLYNIVFWVVVVFVFLNALSII